MKKRLISATSSEALSMNSEELLYAIRESEGRVIMTETIGKFDAVYEVTNAEVAAAMGGDILLLNIFDVDEPHIDGLPEESKWNGILGENGVDTPNSAKNHDKNIIRVLKKLTGRPVGINLEPAPLNTADDSQWYITKGRQATAENAKKALDMGVDLILLTGNPGNGISNAEIIKALKEIRKAVGDKMILAAGKMHAAGLTDEGAENILSLDEIDAFCQAGADIILMPAPGTVPGIDLSWARERVVRTHKNGALACTAIGTSQEGADTDTIKRIALMCKEAGADIHHIGDSGIRGIAEPENIMAYSIAIRGRRHTYIRMAKSINR